jgi:predicted MFS family arabinose efflux permease
MFNTLFGLCWFLGSAAIGFLYDRWGAVPLAVFSVAVQAGAFVLFSSQFLRRHPRDVS